MIYALSTPLPAQTILYPFPKPASRQYGTISLFDIYCVWIVSIAKLHNYRAFRLAVFSVFDTQNTDRGDKGIKARNFYNGVLSDKSQFCKQKKQ
jgi:hypothetical protein